MSDKQNPENKSTVLIFEGSQEGIEKIVELFKQGKLDEIAGIKVLDVGILSEDEFETKGEGDETKQDQ